MQHHRVPHHSCRKLIGQSVIYHPCVDTHALAQVHKKEERHASERALLAVGQFEEVPQEQTSTRLIDDDAADCYNEPRKFVHLHPLREIDQICHQAN